VPLSLTVVQVSPLGCVSTVSRYGAPPPPPPLALHEPNPAVTDTKTNAASHCPTARNTLAVALVSRTRVVDDVFDIARFIPVSKST
jgi:hypothetical protein